MVLECDIWDLATTHILVVPTNLRGVMGRGIAKQFADRFPTGAAWYRKVCFEPDWADTGKQLPMFCSGGYAAVMLPVKDYWADMASVSMIETGLVNLKMWRTVHFDLATLKTLCRKTRYAVPVLGGGFGGLDTEVSVNTIIKSLGSPLKSDYYDLLKPPHAVLEGKYAASFRPGSRKDRSKVLYTEGSRDKEAGS